MEMTDQDIDIAGTEADDSFWQRDERSPGGHETAGAPGSAVSEPPLAGDDPRPGPSATNQAWDLK